MELSSNKQTWSLSSTAFLLGLVPSIEKDSTSLMRETPVQDKLMMMVWDLWDPPCIQDAIESVDNMHPVGQGEAIPVYWIDLLEEGAINEMCCVQVLKLLLSKADEEIGELEKYLLSLRSELKWAENEEWSDLFASALQEKIDYLDISLKSVKSAPQGDDKSCSRMSGEPADDMYEVLKKLLAGNYGRKDKPTGQLNEFTSCKTEVEPNDDARHESCLDSKSVDRALDVPLRPQGTESIPDSDKPMGVSIEQNIPDESQQACFLNGGMKEKSDGALSTNECVDAGLEPISGYLAPIISIKDGVAESKLTVDIVLGSTASSQKSKVKTEVPLGRSLAMDASELQNQSSKGTSKVKEKLDWAGQDDEVAVSNRAAIVSHKMTQGVSRKRKLKSVVASPTKVLPPTVGNSKGISLKKDEERLSCLTNAENASLRKPLTGKTLKEVILSVKSETGQCISFTVAGSTLKNIQNLASSAETADVSADIKLSNSDDESMCSVTDSNCVTARREEIDESQSDERRSSSLAKLDLKSLSLIDLKAIAKQRKIAKYHCLRKSLLVERITDSFSDDCIDRIEVSSRVSK